MEAYSDVKESIDAQAEGGVKAPLTRCPSPSRIIRARWTCSTTSGGWRSPSRRSPRERTPR